MSSAPAPQRSPSEAPALAEVVSAHALQEDKRTGRDKIEEGIQEIVRAELLRAGINIQTRPVQSLKLRSLDIVFLLFGIIDVVLFFWLIPNDFWKEERIAFIKELLPILVGGICGLVATLYRDPLLKLAQNKIFRTLDVIFFVVLIIVLAPLFSFRPEIEPGDAQVTVDSETEPRDLRNPIRVNLREHTFHLKRDENNTRSFTMGKWELLSAWWGRNKPIWSLLYQIPIRSNAKGIAVTIERQRSPFDRDFLRRDSLASYQLKEVNDHRVKYEMDPAGKGGWLILPAGRYNLSFSVPACTANPQPLEIPIDKLTIPKTTNAGEFAVEVKCPN